jgi:hypothetical protein
LRQLYGVFGWTMILNAVSIGSDRLSTSSSRGQTLKNAKYQYLNSTLPPHDTTLSVCIHFLEGQSVYCECVDPFSSPCVDCVDHLHLPAIRQSGSQAQGRGMISGPMTRSRLGNLRQHGSGSCRRLRAVEGRDRLTAVDCYY